MHGVDVAAELIAQHLHREARLSLIDRRAMHEESRGLVDHDQPVVAIEDGQIGSGAHGVALRSNPR